MFVAATPMELLGCACPPPNDRGTPTGMTTLYAPTACA